MYGIKFVLHLAVAHRLIPPVYRYLFASALIYQSYHRLHLDALLVLPLLVYAH